MFALTTADGLLPPRNRQSGGFTLVEVLIATALTLVIMGVTVTLFGNITGRISGSRAIIETNDRLRSCKERLVLDLRGVTAPMLPPLRPEWGLGYFEYVEGSWAAAAVQDDGVTTDTTVGDVDDVLMFTTRSSREPFVGRNGGTTALSQVAEVAWFMRGTTLYRRVLLVLPTESPSIQAGYYGDFDISVRQVGGTQDPTAGAPANAILVANSLGDLTKRENRYGHHPKKMTNANFNSDPRCGYPHGIGRWGQLGLPTLRECSDTGWRFPAYYDDGPSAVPLTGVPAGGFANLPASVDYWSAPHANGLDPATGTLTGYMNGTRIAEDVILTNVIGFDVRAWDPHAPLFTVGSDAVGPGDNGFTAQFDSYLSGGAGAPALAGEGAYVDLDYGRFVTGANQNAARTHSTFSGPGNVTQTGLARTYCTWSTHYESDGLDNDGTFDGNNNGQLDAMETLSADEGTDGIDNNGSGGIDDATEREAPPPYPTPLRGIQVKIRVFEPDSRQIREVTITQDFLPE